MARTYVLLLILGLASCHSKDSVKSWPIGCTDLMGEGISYHLFPETGDLWGENFVKEYKVDSGKFYLSLPANQFSTCMAGDYGGVKAYLALDSAVDSPQQIHRHLCLILVPYVDTVHTVTNDSTIIDVAFTGDCGPFLQVGPGNAISPVDSSTAAGYIEHWSNHYVDSNLIDSIIVPINAFVIPSFTIQEAITYAQAAGADHRVYMIFGYHTISPDDIAHCLENAPARLHPANINTYGYGVLALILSTRKGETFAHSSDFLRPCPRFCGDSKFHHIFATD